MTGFMAEGLTASILAGLVTGAGGFHLFTFQVEGGGRRKYLHQRVSISDRQTVITAAPEGILRIRPQFIV